MSRSGRSAQGCTGGQLAVVGGQVGQQVPDVGEAALLVVVGEVGDSGGGGVGVGAAQVVLADPFSGDGLDHVRSRDEHLRGAAHHEHEVGQGRGVGRSARAGSQHDADLRDDPGVADVALEDAAVAGERAHAFLDARPGAVAQAHDGGAGGGGHVHDLVDLLGVRLSEGASEDPEVVGVGEDGTSPHPAPAGDHTVGVGAPVLQAEAGRPVPAQPLDLGEAAVVEEEGEPFPGGELALGVLGRGGLLPRPLAHGVPYGP